MSERTSILSLRNRASLRSGGFTLLELLVAIMILTLIMTASFGSVRIASRSWEAGQSLADASEEMRTVSDFLRRRFAQMSAFVWLDGSQERIAFIGDQKQLRFIAPAPDYADGPGLFIYTMTIDTEDGLEQLLLSYAPFDPGTGDFNAQTDVRRTVLTDNLTSAAFEYYGSERDDTEPSWQVIWQPDAERFPAMIRIATARDGPGSGWPDLMFPLHANDSL